MNKDSIIVICLISAWVISLLHYQKKKRVFDAGSFIICLFLFYAFCSLLLLHTENYASYFQPLCLSSFVYLFLMELITASPILRLDNSKTEYIKTPNFQFFNYVGWFFIIMSCLNLPNIVMGFVRGVQMIMIDSSGGLDLYQESLASSYNEGKGGISNLPAIFSGAFSGIGMLFFVYSLTRDDISKFMKFWLGISCFLLVMNGISLGQRGLVIEPLLVLSISYYALKKFMPENTIKKAKALMITIMVLLSFPMVALTISRFDQVNTNPLESTYYYVGQQNLYFNNYGLDNNGIRYGDRTVPLFKKMLFFDDVPDNFWERREKYPNLRINDEVFVSYVGDITLDFGPIGGAIIMLLLSILLCRVTAPRGDYLTFSQLILLHWVMYLVVVGSLKLYPFSDTAGNLKLIVYVFTSLLFSLTDNK